MKKKKASYLPVSSEAFDGTLYLPFEPEDDSVRFRTVYILGSEEGEIRSITAYLQKHTGWRDAPAAVVALHPHEWIKDYSPLAAPPLREGAAPFSPGAGEHLRKIASELIPALERQYPLTASREARTLAGYSLAGLAALYAAYTASDVFRNYAACSASLWMEGWMDFMRTTPLPRKDVRIYLSLGKKEPETKNERTRRVGTCFEEAASTLSAALPENAFCSAWNDGNHFFEPDRRIARGLAFLLSL